MSIKKYKNGQKIITIAGYAGTGKSTIVNAIVDALGLKSKVAYCTF